MIFFSAVRFVAREKISDYPSMMMMNNGGNWVLFAANRQWLEYFSTRNRSLGPRMVCGGVVCRPQNWGGPGLALKNCDFHT
jgi:hypothetical protein